MEYTDKQHNYFTLNNYLKQRFNQKVFKVALNGNFTCPNRDGKVSTRGCIFCSPSGSGDYGGKRGKPLSEQFSTLTKIIHHKWPEAGYIAYFQANTNTYKPLSELKKLYTEAINLSDKIVALSIATRPDCLSEDIVSYLGDLNKKIPVWIELGLQTTNEDTAKLINRGYKLDVFEKAVTLLRKYNIETIVHIINGLPYETQDDMINTVKYLNNLDIQGVKIHSLFILENTELALLYRKEKFHVLTKEEYVKITALQLSHLRKEIVIHRINGDAPLELLIEPKWSIKKLVVMNDLDKYMKANNITQGCNINKSI